MRWVEIFSTGKKTCRRGVEQDYPASRLAAAVESYDPTRFRAPLIVRHDTKGVADHVVADQPFCFGYPKALQVVGDKLKAGFDTIAPEFLEWVKDGNLISISPSFYNEDDPRNPTPGKLHLRHIAALGTDPPSDKNLRGLEELLEYAEGGDEYEISPPANWLCEFEEPNPIEDSTVDNNAGLLSRVEAMSQQIEKLLALNTPVELERITGTLQTPEFGEGFERLAHWGLKTAVMQSGKSLEAIAMAADITADRLRIILDGGNATWEESSKIADALGLDDLEYSEPTPRELAVRQREAELAKREAELRKQQISEFMEPLVKAGQVLPGDRAALETVLLHLEASTPLEFAEGDGVVEKSPAEVVRDWLGRLKPQIEYSELAAAEDEELPTVEYNEPPGYTVNRDKAKKLAEAKQYAAKHDVSLEEALKLSGVK